MYPHSFLWHYLWIAPHALQIIIAVVMVRRGWFREFPVFFIYTVFDAIAEGTLFTLDHIQAVSSDQYWTVYSVFLGVEVALRFAIIFELFSSVFRNYPGLRRLTRVLFRGATVVLLFAAIAIAARAPNGGSLPIHYRVHVLDLGVDVMQGGLLL